MSLPVGYLQALTILKESEYTKEIDNNFLIELLLLVIGMSIYKFIAK